MGFRPLRKRRQGKKSAEGIAAKTSVGASRSVQLSVDDLLMAKNVSGDLGGTDKAIAVLRAGVGAGERRSRAQVFPACNSRPTATSRDSSTRIP